MRARRTVLAALTAICLSGCDESLLDSPSIPADGVRLVAVDGQQLPAQVRVPASLRVRVLDADGRPLRSIGVRYVLLAGSGFFLADSTVTDDQGYTEVQFLPLGAGTTIVEAGVGPAGEDGRVRFTILVRSDPDEGAIFVSAGGDAQTAAAGTVLPEPLVVSVRNPDGLGVDSFPVTFVIQQELAGLAASRNGPFSGQITVRTDASGRAQAFLLLGPASGDYTVSATATLGPPGARVTETVTFTATATPLEAARLVVLSGDDQTVVIDTLHAEDSEAFQGRDPNPFVLRALDKFGGPVSGVAIHWRVSDGGGRLSGQTTFTDSDGIAENMLTEVTEGENVVAAFAAETSAVEFVVTGELLEPPPPPPEEEAGD